jgi:ADP-ribose pyrophosphatase YjhB (NUDIX family)
MHQPKREGEVVFQTPWFEVLSRRIPGSDRPHYSIHASDFVAIVAVTPAGELLMVRQFRPTVGAHTLELPAGHVEPGETPEIAARKELVEETGYEAEQFELIATLSPSTARFTNRMWCFFAANARRRTDAQIEDGMEPVLYGKGLAALLNEKEFYSSGSCAALFAAIIRGKLRGS